MLERNRYRTLRYLSFHHRQQTDPVHGPFRDIRRRTPHHIQNRRKIITCAAGKIGSYGLTDFVRPDKQPRYSHTAFIKRPLTPTEWTGGPLLTDLPAFCRGRLLWPQDHYLSRTTASYYCQLSGFSVLCAVARFARPSP